MHFASQCPVAQKWVDIPLQKEQLELFLDQKTKIETRDSSSYRIQIKFNSGEEVTIVSLEQSFIRSFTAFESICPHSGGPLYRGIIQDIEDSAAASSNGGGGGGGCSSSAFHGSVVLCPWHEYGFDISSTGEGIENEFNIRIFKVELVEDSSSPLKIKILVPDSSTSIIDSATVFSVPNRCRQKTSTLSGTGHAILNQLTTSLNEINVFKNDNEKSTSSSLASTTVPSIIPSTPFLTPPFKSLVEYGAEILNTPNPHAKVSLTNQVAELWKSGKLAISSSTISLPCSSILALPSDAVPPREDLEFTAPSKARKLGGAGTVESRISILHSLASIEQWAIDLAWDIIVRFADYRLAANDDDDDVDDGSSLDRFLPMAFFSDFVKVAADEAKHFSMLINRIKELGSFYGAFPIHGALWESAQETDHDILCRLAIVHMVHEARGLDINPRTLAKFQRQGDTESVRVLDIIHNDEITHVAAGQRWFSFILSEMKKLGMPFETNCMRGRDVVSASTSACSGVFVDADSSQYDDRYVLFHRIVRKHYFSKLKPPFNNEDRLKAGLDTDYYIPLS